MSILSRYLILQYLRVFVLGMAAACGLYLIIDVFDRVGEVVPFAPSWSRVVLYFLAKLPKILYDIFPAASLLAALLSLALLTRNREILALKACGLSSWQLALPILAVSAVLSIAALFWNENVVPVAASRSRWIWDVELKQKAYRGVFDSASIWYQSDRGFVHIRRYDAGKREISGLTIYESDAAFRLHRIIDVGSMRWHDGRWQGAAGVVKDLLSPGNVQVRPLTAGEFELHEDPDNLAARKRRSEEFSFRQLREQIAQLQARGLGADEFLVDLHHKLAWPFAGLVVTLMGLPLALRSGPRSGVASSLGLGLVIGFAYWILTGLALSAGRTGAMSPVVAAWIANAVFGVIAAFLYIGRDA
ncbi:MAG TPA: LPS export ABC transporter permease LptG [Candidatus Limnocylindrales bacterium]|nr:LPS export ABC transporter permease LptG [Candidatus Limnocylindrales bacterium]